MAPIMEWTYEFDKKTESILDIPQKVICKKRRPDCLKSINIPVYVVNSGFHSYRKTSLRKGQKKIFDTFIEVSAQIPRISWYIRVDWHYQNITRGEVLCSAHIPRGSFYYLNEWGEYVSDTLIIDKVLDANKELKELKKR